MSRSTCRATHAGDVIDHGREPSDRRLPMPVTGRHGCRAEQSSPEPRDAIGEDLDSSEPIYGRLHAWSDDECLRCGLTRVAVWVLDEDGRPVQALKWSDAHGDPVRVRPFAFMLGLTPPPLLELRAASVVFEGLDVGPEPFCLADEPRAAEPSSSPDDSEETLDALPGDHT